MGSSPRVRGTDQVLGVEVAMAGIIPARAGNSRAVGTDTLQSRDHPRACGEQDVTPSPSMISLGSSPRVRGTGRYQLTECETPGIIPARAGNSAYCRTVFKISAGSSPRVRGTGEVARGAVEPHRIIPARAGNSYFQRWGYSWGWGSSPRVRGTDEVHGARELDAGIIPARAGNRQ